MTPVSTSATRREGEQQTGWALRCDRVSARLGGRSVLDDVSLELRRGEWLGLIGPNGAGKTTLLRAVIGLVDHDGSVSLADGRRPTASDVALVPQSPTLPAGMSVIEYVLLGRTAHLGWLSRESGRDREVTVSVLQRLGLEQFATRRLSALSGGELQRVVIARALAQEAPILLLDEPTSALDPGRQAEVLELVDDLRVADGLSVVAVMHDLTTAARFADRLVLLDDGRLITSGRSERVLDAGLLSRIYGTPLSVQRIDGDLVVLPARRPSRAAAAPSALGENPGR